MPLTKHYLRYVHAATLGVVTGRKSNVLLVEGGGSGRRRALVVAAAVEDVKMWDPRRGEEVGHLVHAHCDASSWRLLTAIIMYMNNHVHRALLENT